MSIEDAKSHIEEAYRLLTSAEARQIDPVTGEIVPILDFCVIAEELERIDAALGKPGSTLLAGMAQVIRAAYVEIIAARRVLKL